ncbi:Na-translocating system protein MpsC family protein [Alkalicoccus daliensis]|uniref:Uncharacterized protein YbcI n=1 Tax=Alkalicoccus daliensis TaxID=745820 RepID=A0A1H0FVD4_9BACI|nr:Na-translocating system protein MpsC family protein [Alkalicoccus daliensis]SDN98627.1 Uncharacterized protein YbcI [Alkalicoccus daliensis]
MTKDRPLEAEVGGYITSMLRTNFGKGPTSVYVTLKPPFFTVHLRGFLAPMEKILLKQNETERVLETRDMLMQEMQQEIKHQLWDQAKLDVREIYADWQLENETGVIFGVLKQGQQEEKEWPWPEDVNREELTEKLKKASKNAEKTPVVTEVFWLNDRTILVKRSGILVRIEKELIKRGVIEDLKLAKRPLERRVLIEVGLEETLKRHVDDYFVDWDFENDLGYTVITLQTKKQTPKG